jgi:hypothetical protein
MHLFHTPVSSTSLIALTVIYFICACVTTFDTRIIQAKKNGYLKENEAHVPVWTGIFGILMWLCWVAIFLLNWWYAFLLFAIKFVLKVLPILENIGALLLLPVVGKETAAAVNTVSKQQKHAANKLKQMERNLKKS